MSDDSATFWRVLADWVNVILTLPDPPPLELSYANDVVIVSAIAALTARLSPEVGDSVRAVLLPVINDVMPAAAGSFGS